MTEPLPRALQDCWDVFGSSDTLFPTLALDAVLARAGAGEWQAATPRLLELLTGPDALATGEERASAVRGLESAGWGAWPRAQREAVLAVLDSWWRTSLMLHPSSPDIEIVLASLARFDLPLVRWLNPWIEDLDGAPALHFADLILGRLGSPLWTDQIDQRGQIIGWARTEPVVMGIALVGGTHLDEGQLAQVLDLLLI